MKLLSQHEVRIWCEKHGVQATPNGFSFLGGAGEHSVDFSIPMKPHQVIFLANALVPKSEREPFDEAVFLISDWGIWNEEVEKVGQTIIESFRKPSGTESLHEKPGHLFHGSERSAVCAFLVQAISVGWDAYVFFDKAEHFLFVSHDEWVRLIARTSDVAKRFAQSLSQWALDSHAQTGS